MAFTVFSVTSIISSFVIFPFTESNVFLIMESAIFISPFICIFNESGTIFFFVVSGNGFSTCQASQPPAFCGVAKDFTLAIFSIPIFPSSMIAMESFGISSGFFFFILASLVSLKPGFILQTRYLPSSVMVAP